MTISSVFREYFLSSKRLKSRAWDTSSIEIQSNDAETALLELELYRHHLEQLEYPTKCLRIAVMDREPKNSPTGMTSDQASDVQ